jgi:hypothetical protein
VPDPVAEPVDEDEVPLVVPPVLVIPPAPVPVDEELMPPEAVPAAEPELLPPAEETGSGVPVEVPMLPVVTEIPWQPDHRHAQSRMTSIAVLDFPIRTYKQGQLVRFFKVSLGLVYPRGPSSARPCPSSSSQVIP